MGSWHLFLVLSTLFNCVQVVEEGDEPDEFWEYFVNG
jgi:hypothetical protein